MCRFIILLINLAILVAVNSESTTDYDFILERIDQNTSNPDIVNPKLSAIPVQDGTFAVNGTIFVGSDIDNTYSGSAQIYQSAAANMDFEETRYKIANTNFYDLMTRFYVLLLQNDFNNCTNFPQHDKQFDSPLPKGNYYFDNCIITKDGLPDHLDPGFYKISLSVSGENLELGITGYFFVYPINVR